MARIKFEVSFDLPKQATIENAVDYLYDAVGTMRGCYKPPPMDDYDDGPADPMWFLKADTVKVKRIISGKS